jgi:hypothetical protein
MIDPAVVFVYGSFIGIAAVSIGTVLKPFLTSSDK